MIKITFENGALEGEKVIRAERRLKDLPGAFLDEKAFLAMDADTLLYRVEMHDAEKEGTPGGLFFGASFIMPGKVGREYFMTRGHFHAKVACAEYYWGISGTGWLLLMDADSLFICSQPWQC